MNLQSVFDGHFFVTYRGVAMMKCPFDYVIYQMIISQVKPDLVIEIGTDRGGGALYLADLLNNVGHGVVHTIDIIDLAPAMVSEHPRIKRCLGGWDEYAIANATPFDRVMVIDDGSHQYADVAGALRKFSPLVKPGSYYIVEDGIIEGLGIADQFGGGPTRATREFLQRHGGFAVDHELAGLFGAGATFNTDGYLKRL